MTGERVLDGSIPGVRQVDLWTSALLLRWVGKHRDELVSPSKISAPAVINSQRKDPHYRFHL